MEELDDILLKAEMDEITKRIASTMSKLEDLDINQQQNPPEPEES